MALNVGRSATGGVRIIPARARSAQVRRLAAAEGVVGFRHRGRTGEFRPGAGLSFGGILRGIGRGVSGFLTGGPVGAIGAVAGPSIAPTISFAPPSSSCPTGFRRNAAGQCVTEGVLGGFERFVPGGRTGTLADASGEAVVGAFGLPALQPMQVGTITRNDGTVGPILRCRKKMVLGTDNLCYPKAILSRRSMFRKHRLPVRPPVSGADMAAIRRAASTKDKVKELAQDVGWTCKAKTGGRRKK